MTVPTTAGLYTLTLEQDHRPVLLADLEWNGERSLGVLPVHLLRRSAAEPVLVRQGTPNKLEVEALGVSGSAVLAKLEGWLVDEASPAIAWTSPPDGAALQADALLRLSLEDAITGVVDLEVVLDGSVDVTSAFVRRPDGAEAPLGALPPLTPGAHSLTARARDAACNEAVVTVAFSVAGASSVTWAQALAARAPPSTGRRSRSRSLRAGPRASRRR